MNPIYTYMGGIRTYHYLLECRLHGRNKIDKVDQLMNIYMVNYIYNCCVSSDDDDDYSDDSDDDDYSEPIIDYSDDDDYAFIDDTDRDY